MWREHTPYPLSSSHTGEGSRSSAPVQLGTPPCWGPCENRDIRQIPGEGWEGGGGRERERERERGCEKGWKGIFFKAIKFLSLSPSLSLTSSAPSPDKTIFTPMDLILRLMRYLEGERERGREREEGRGRVRFRIGR